MRKNPNMRIQYHQGPRLSRYILYTLQSTEPEAFSSSWISRPASLFRTDSFCAIRASVVTSSESASFSWVTRLAMFVLLTTREGAVLDTGVFAPLRRRLCRIESVSSPNPLCFNTLCGLPWDL